jgi:hypothetical protein
MEAERQNSELKTALTAGTDISLVTDNFNVKRNNISRQAF